jgi:TolA-binding protein
MLKGWALTASLAVFFIVPARVDAGSFWCPPQSCCPPPWQFCPPPCDDGPIGPGGPGGPGGTQVQALSNQVAQLRSEVASLQGQVTTLRQEVNALQRQRQALRQEIQRADYIWRTWTNQAGQSVVASLKSVEGGRAYFENKSGAPASTLVANLSAVDQQWIQNWQRSKQLATRPTTAPTR